MYPPVAALRLGSLALFASALCWSLLACLGIITAPQGTPTTPMTQAASLNDETSAAVEPSPTARLESQIAELHRELASVTARHDELLQGLASLRRTMAQPPDHTALESRLTTLITESLKAHRSESPSVPVSELATQVTRQTERANQLQQHVSALRDEVASLTNQMASLLAASTEPLPTRPTLTTKLYRPLRLRADVLQPMVQTLLTPELGLWTTVALPGDERDAILVCDHPDVLAQVDRLISELDQPLPGLEFEFSLQEIDPTTGRPESLATPLARELFPTEGNSLIVPESVLQQHAPTAATSTRSRETNTEARVLRITPRLIR